MKSTILILFTPLILISCATLNFNWGETVAQEERTYQKVIELPENSKNEIYDKTREWMVKIFVDSESVIELTDKENGKIMGKYSQSDVTVAGMNATYQVRYTLIIEIKNNKSRITVENPFMISYVSPLVQGRQQVNSPIEKEVFINSLKENQWPALISSYESYIKKKENDDW